MDRSEPIIADAGRERELEAILRVHALVRDGVARRVLVVGPKGIGKSWLLQAAARRMAAKGIPVASARAGRGVPVALGLVRELVSSLVEVGQRQGIEAADLSRITARLGRLLASRHAPSLVRPGEPIADSHGSREAARLEQVDALAELIARVGRSGAALIVDELDAADRGSRELLAAVVAALAAPVGSTGIFILAASRDDAMMEDEFLSRSAQVLPLDPAPAGGISPAARRVFSPGARTEGGVPAPLGALSSRALIGRIEALPGETLTLGSLDADGILSFLESADLPARLLQITDGVPAKIEEMLVPRPADFAIRRLGLLEPDARRCLLGAAILGRPASASLLLELGGRRGGMPMIQRLVDERFLQAGLSAGMPVYELAREDDRPRLLEMVASDERIELHRLVAEELIAMGGEAEEIARHFLVAEPQGRGLDYAVRAAEILLDRCAYDGAAELYRAALATGVQEARPIHLRLAEILETAGDPIGALRHIGLSRKRATADEVRTSRAQAARICVQIGKVRQALRLAARVLGPTGIFEADDLAGAISFAAACEARFLRGELEEVVASCKAGIERAAGFPEICVDLRNSLGKAYINLGAYDASAEAFAENIAEADAAGLLREQMRALLNKGVVAHRQNRIVEAFERYREARAIGADPFIDALAVGNIGALSHEVGDFEVALDDYSSAIASFVRARRPKETSHHSLNLARLKLFLGDLEGALSTADFARSEAAKIGDPYLMGQADLITSDIMLARGEPSRAEAILSLAWDAFGAIGHQRYQTATGLSLVRAYLALGNPAAAREQLGRALALDDPGKDALGIELELLEAELSLAEGRLPEAARQLELAKGRLFARADGVDGLDGVGGEADLEAPWKTYALLASLHAAEGDLRGASADRLRAVRFLEELAKRVPEPQRQGFLDLGSRRRLLLELDEGELTSEQVEAMRRLDRGAEPAETIIGRSPALRRLLQSVGKVGRSMVPVLLRGETGTGKELVADAIHLASPRRDQPMIKVNCAAMNEELLLSELFGHEKGAFTGAVTERKGRFELADGGTIFLDEVGDLSPRAQVALLRVLQEKAFERVGGSQTLRTDARVIAATNRDLEALIAEGRFREDLYYRLDGVRLDLPPLRGRLEDIPALAAHFLQRNATERGQPTKRLSSTAVTLLKGWSWPGNVRELENVVAAVSIFAEGDVIDLDAFEQQGRFLDLLESARANRSLEGFDEAARAAPLESLDPAGLDFYELARSRGLGIRELRDEIESQMIARALQESRGNISEAARLLQMKRSRLSQIVNADPKLLEVAKLAS